jgi:hypothetical protein
MTRLSSTESHVGPLLNETHQARRLLFIRMELLSLITLLVGALLLFYVVRALIKLSLSLALFLLVLTVGGVLSFLLLPAVRSIVSSFRSV